MKEEISAKDIFYFTITIVLPTLILLVATSLSSASQQMGWISLIISGSIIGILQYILLKLSLNFSNNSVINDCKVLLNPFIANILIMLYLVVLTLDSGLVLVQIVQYIKYVIPEIDYASTYYIVSLLPVYLLYKGIEVFARVNKIGILLFFTMLLLVIGFIILDFKLTNFNHLLPIVIDAKTLIKGSIIPASWFILIPSLLLMLKPYCSDKNKFIRNSLLGNLLIQVIVIILFIISIATLGVNLASTLSYPFYSITKLIAIGMEVIVFLVWIMAAILKLAIFYFVAVKGYSDYFSLKDYKIIIIPFAILISSLTLFQYEDILLEGILFQITFGEAVFIYLIIIISLIVLYLYHSLKNKQ